MGQYTFKGSIDPQQWGETVYLSIIDDYRKSSSIYTDQIFLKLTRIVLEISILQEMN